MNESPFLREVMNQGRVEVKRTDTLKVLKQRFSEEAAGALAPQLDECADLDQLNELFDLALEGASIDEFRKALTSILSRPAKGSTRRSSTD